MGLWSKLFCPIPYILYHCLPRTVFVLRWHRHTSYTNRRNITFFAWSPMGVSCRLHDFWPVPVTFGRLTALLTIKDNTGVTSPWWFYWNTATAGSCVVLRRLERIKLSLFPPIGDIVALWTSAVKCTHAMCIELQLGHTGLKVVESPDDVPKSQKYPSTLQCTLNWLFSISVLADLALKWVLLLHTHAPSSILTGEIKAFPRESLSCVKEWITLSDARVTSDYPPK